MFFDQIGIETIVAGWNRSVGGEDHFTSNAGHGFLKADTFLFHSLANRLQDGESAVSLVQMKHSGSDAQRFQRAQTAHAEQQFLVHAHPAVASV